MKTRHPCRFVGGPFDGLVTLAKVSEFPDGSFYVVEQCREDWLAVYRVEIAFDLIVSPLVVRFEGWRPKSLATK